MSGLATIQALLSSQTLKRLSVLILMRAPEFATPMTSASWLRSFLCQKTRSNDLAAGLSPLPVLLPRKHGRQKPEFGLHFDGIGHSIGDFLAKEFAIPLAKPVNGHLERSF